MIEILKLTAEQVKTYCTAAKLKELNDKELVDIFHFANKFLFEFNGSFDVQNLVEREWWGCANGLISDELNKRGIAAMYIGILKGNEGGSAIELLNMKDEDFQIQAYAMLDSIDTDGLKRVEKEVAKVSLQNPHLYQPYLAVVREEISRRTNTGAMLN